MKKSSSRPLMIYSGKKHNKISATANKKKKKHIQTACCLWVNHKFISRYYFIFHSRDVTVDIACCILVCLHQLSWWKSRWCSYVISIRHTRLNTRHLFDTYIIYKFEVAACWAYDGSLVRGYKLTRRNKSECVHTHCGSWGSHTVGRKTHTPFSHDNSCVCAWATCECAVIAVPGEILIAGKKKKKKSKYLTKTYFISRICTCSNGF